MTSRSKLAITATLILLGVAVLTITPSAYGWSKSFRRGTGWEDKLEMFCDGPHRVYFVSPPTADSTASLFVLKDGCVGWPKDAKLPAEAPQER